MPAYKNSFKSPDHVEEQILDEDGGLIGTLRIKPSSILWKPKGQHKYFAVPLEAFAEWIVSSHAKATRAKS